MKKKFSDLFLILLFTLLFSAMNSPAQVRISEFLADNVSVNPDNWDFEDFSDWIELHNTGSSQADIGGYTLTDDLKETRKWKIPAGTTIPAGGYLLIWADDHDGKPGQTETREWYPWNEKYQLKGYHAVFMLDKAGEEIGLFDAAGSLVDSVRFGRQYSDVSMGRQADGSWAFFDEPTPGKANTTTAKPLTTAQFSGEVTFSVEGGMFTSSQTVTLSTTDGSDIYYTTDGSIPYKSSLKYSSPISAGKTTTIRARAIAADKFAGRVATSTYFINLKKHSVMVVSISTDPAFLDDNTIGIWKNGMKGREVPAAFEFFTTDGKRVVHFNAGMRNGTLTSFNEAQHPLQIALRERYGDPFVEYRFFDKPITRFSRFRLRQGGDAWNNNFIGDVLLDPINKNQTAVGVQAFRATVVYVNGDYYGLMNLREQFKEQYFIENFGVDPEKRDEVRSILQPSSGDAMGTGSKEGWELVAGSWDTYRSLISSVKSGSINASKYEELKAIVDLGSLSDFFCYIAFGVAISWGHNQDLWKVPDGKWRWLVTDFDRAWVYKGSFNDVSHNPFTTAAGASPSIVPGDTLFSKLIAYTDYRNYFVQRYAAHLNSTFKSSRLTAIVDSIARIVEPEMADHTAKWGGEGGIRSVSSWNSEVDDVIKFMNERQDYCWKHLTQQPFNVSNGRANLTVKLSPAEAQADILVNGVRMSQGLASISLFKGIPFEVTPKAQPGWRFTGWEDNGTSSPLTVTLNGSKTITATFEKASGINAPRLLSAGAPGFIFESKCTRHNGETLLTLSVASSSADRIAVDLFDIHGRKISTLLDCDIIPEERYALVRRISAAPGIYLYRIHAKEFIRVKPVTIR